MKIFGIFVCMLLISVSCLSSMAINDKSVDESEKLEFELIVVNDLEKSITTELESSQIISNDVYDIYEGLHWQLKITFYWDPPQPEKLICLWVDINSLPLGANFPECTCNPGQVSGVLDWTPSVGQAGTYNIVFYAGETCYEPTGQLTVTVVVHPYNPDPQKTFDIYEEEPWSLVVVTSWVPPQPEKLICLWINTATLPEGAYFTPCHCEYGQVSSILDWTPSVGQAGTYIITFLAGEDCGYYRFPFSIRVNVHKREIPGISFSQVDFTFANAYVSNSDWGHIEVNISEFTDFMGFDEGYINVFSDAGWVVQNFLIDYVPGMHEIVKYFDLGVEPGTDIVNLSAYMEFTSDPIVVFDDGPRVIYPVETISFNAEGMDSNVITIPSAPPTLVFDPLGDTWHFTKQQGPNENVQCAHMQCFPMAIANSFQYLNNRYGFPLKHPHNKGLKGDGTLVGKLDSACNRGVTNRSVGNGVSIPQMLEGKFKYLNDSGLKNELVHKHQGTGFFGATPGDFTRHGITSKDESVSGKVTFEWICEELKKCEDVELVYRKDGGGGHAVRVFGCGKKNGVPFLRYKHDRNQTNRDPHDNTGLEEPEVDVKDIDGDGYLNFGSANREIVFAMSESPKFPTWHYHFWSDYIHPDEEDVCRGGRLEVWGTLNCEKVLQIYSGNIEACTIYSGYIPFSIWWPINDLMFDFYWDYACENEEHVKFVLPYYNYNLGQWMLRPIYEWAEEHLMDDLYIPMMGDPTGEISDVYYVINLQEFFDDPRPPQEMYEISSGESEDLPGYLIGTTPIIFDPDAPPDSNPFSTAVLSGVLYNDGDIRFEPKIMEPSIEIESINTGIGINAVIANNGDAVAHNIEWSIDLDGLVFLGAETSGIIETLEPDDTFEINSDLIIGFGPITIMVTADVASETRNGFLLLLYVLGM